MFGQKIINMIKNLWISECDEQSIFLFVHKTHFSSKFYYVYDSLFEMSICWFDHNFDKGDIIGRMKLRYDLGGCDGWKEYVTLCIFKLK